MKHDSIMAVLDTSVIYALIDGEKINFSDDNLEHCTATCYNIAEVVNKMVLKKKTNHMDTWILVESLIPNPYAIDMHVSRIATGLSEIIDSSFGISLGDKLCLALDIILNKPIYTADKVWKQFEKKLGITINLVR